MNVRLRNKKLIKGVIRYYLDIYIEGKRSYEFLDVKIYPSDTTSIKGEKKKIAELIRSNKELELLTDITSYVPKHLKNVNFLDFADNFITNYTKKDVRMLKATLKQFKKYLNNDNLNVLQITPSIMYGFKDYLIDQCGLTGETPHNYFTRFKKIISSAELKGLIKDNPTKDIKFRKQVGDTTLKKQVLNTEELQLLASTYCGNENVKKAFLFSCYSGLGEAEIKVLKWNNISNNQLITFRKKTKQKIQIKLKENIFNLLGERGKKDEYIFNLKNKSGVFLSTNAINKCIKNWVERANIDKHITFYCARHSFATQLLQYGADLKSVSNAMGHTNVKSTIKYLNYIDNLKDNAIDNLPDINF